MRKGTSSAAIEAHKEINEIAETLPQADFAETDRLLRCGQPFLALRAARKAAVVAVARIVRGIIRSKSNEVSLDNTPLSVEIQKLLLERFGVGQGLVTRDWGIACEEIWDYLESLPDRIKISTNGRLLLGEALELETEIRGQPVLSENLLQSLSVLTNEIRQKIAIPSEGRRGSDLSESLLEIREGLRFAQELMVTKVNTEVQRTGAKSKKKEERRDNKIRRRDKRGKWRQELGFETDEEAVLATA